MPAPDPSTNDLTGLLRQMRSGDASAAERFAEAIYGELRRLAGRKMRAERSGHTLQTTALVNEAYLRLMGSGDIDWQDRSHFLGVAARQMRLVLIDHARGAKAQKRGGGAAPVTFEEGLIAGVSADSDVLAVDDALRQLEQVHERAAKVVELKFFGGYTDQESADILGVAHVTVRRDWDFAKAWLFRRLKQ